MHIALPVAAAFAAGLGAAPANAADWENARTIVVTGAGEATKAPDMAFLTLGVEADAATASEALRKNSDRMEATIKTLRDAGVDKKDIQTSSLSVGARYDYSREGQAPRLIGYQATNTVSVKLRNLEKAGGIIDRAVSAGSNRLDSISFGFADPKPLLNQARRGAVVEARERALLYAEAAGVSLGAVLQISDSFAAAPGPYPVAMRADLAEAKAVPIAAGEQTIAASVTIVYAIQ
ncbi:MAG: SIMPL domain-containing protein [Parvularculaceae bacterium]|nr:SIMPL domain-containing protein [Parvularculaceae bacterium]